MHDNRDGGRVDAPGRAGTPPPAGGVQGLGLVDALRIDVDPPQLPWLVAELEIVQYCLEDELAHQRKRLEGPPAQAGPRPRPTARDAEQALERRVHQLRVLAMIRDQLPISSEAARVGTADPWATPADDPGGELHHDATPVALVGPAALMTVLICRATRHVADALGDALRGPQLDVDEHTDSSAGWSGGELPRVDPAIADRFRAMAAAARAFTDTYLQVLAHQAYDFDPGSTPGHANPLERRPAGATRRAR